MPDKARTHGESTKPTNVFTPKVPSTTSFSPSGSYTTKVPDPSYSRRESPKPTNVFK